MATRQDKEKGVNVQVLLRCRPFSDEELRSNAPQVVTCNDYQREVAVSQNIAGKQIDRVFTFDKVFGPSAQQRDLYDQAVVPIVNEVLEGFNCTIFAYGQTGTGKTYTMEGECRRSKSGPRGQLPSDAGVIPRAVKQIFDTLEGQNAEYSVKVTFLELYNEEITDLLAPEEISKIALDEKQKKTLPLMEDGKGGVLVRGLEEEIVTSANEIFSLLERGSAKRRTAETLLNKQSSRSHSLFSITIHIKEATPEGEELIKCGKLNLVDLAGSENISRSGAREGRAREAGEINKSLLTLGRVITALVEHLGHIPYRDSKLTRLLRDSLGGRTKTCIIATVSPSVHCLEETLSTLDYAHRAKNIKNRPEVNQKMMKSALIKDLYGEIDRLKAEVFSAREKNGVYIPKERYYQEESERKAMAEQIEQMESSLEANQKQIEELQNKFDAETQHSCELSIQLESTEKNLEQRNIQLDSVKEELKKCQYDLKERDYIISEQKKAENALAHKACLLHSDLDKSVQDVSSLFLKIDREEKLNAANRSVVDNYQIKLAEKIHILCSTVVESLNRQSEHLQSVEKLCHTSLDFHDKSVSELKAKVLASRTLYVSHIETVQNIVRLHKAGINAGLEEASSLSSSNFCSIEQLLTKDAAEANTIFSDLQHTLSDQQGEIANFARELRARCHWSLECIRETTEFSVRFLEKLGEETGKLRNHVGRTHEAHIQSIVDFQKVYEEHSKSMEQKLLDDVSKLISNAIHRKKELVNERLVGLRDAAVENKAVMDDHASSMEAVASDAKRKWDAFSKHAENSTQDIADFSAAKHCRMEQFLQQCFTTVGIATGHMKRTHESIKEIGREHVTAVESLVRNTTESNEQHDSEIGAARTAAEQDIAMYSEDILQHFESVSRNGQEVASSILVEIEGHIGVLRKLQDDHLGRVTEIEQQTHDTFTQQYTDYEPSGTTPTRCEMELPTSETIESLRAMPMESLVEEFRENHPYVPKEPKPSLIPRTPLVQLN